MNDEEYMKLALNLAEQGMGHTSPNPMVGAVIVKDGQIIGSGYHQIYGGPHAERNALRNCRSSPEGATLYVTLEPCCHYGKTPPCVDAILESGISRVVVGSRDMNPQVSGEGIRILRSHGVEVTEGVLTESCTLLNRAFFHYISTGRPYVVMKYAMTLDGKIASASGLSQWITGEAARMNVHLDRLRYSAIMTGVGTVINDDPALTCRLSGGRNPIRIICDSHLRTPLTAQVVVTAGQVRTILATCCTEETRQAPYLGAGCELIVVPERNGQVDLNILMEELGSRKIDGILLEGGSTLNWSALHSGIVRLVQAYLAPKLLGGEAAKSPIGGTGFPSPDDAQKLSSPTIRQFGADLLLESEVLPCLQA